MGKRRDSSSSRNSSRSRSRSRRRSHSSRRRSRRSASADRGDSVRVHVSDLPVSCSTKDLEKTFEKFGPLVEVWKTNSSPCFAFVVFQNKDDANEAIRGLNGQNVCGSRVRVTMALPRARERRRHAVFNSDARCYQCGQPGHFSRSCHNYEGAGRNRMMPSPRRRSRRHRSTSSSSRSRSRSRSHRRRSSRDRRSRSRDRRSRDRRRSRSHDRNRSSDRRRGSRDKDKEKDKETERHHDTGDEINAEDIIAAQT